MTKVTQTSSRKSEHIRINLEENVSSTLTTGLEKLKYIHEALPEFDLKDVDIKLNLLGKQLNSPLLISSMTGGTKEAEKLNLKLAEAAEEMKIAMGVGSQRAAIENSVLESTFQVRNKAPNILLFANIGAVQLNYGYGVEECQKAVDMIEADALILHFNSLQEAVQPEGDTNFSKLLPKIEDVCLKLNVPVIAKEVGWGFSGDTAKKLWDAGVAFIDVAGAGGTSWSQVEMHRAKSQRQARLASAFIDWGIPTSESIIQIRKEAPEMTILASGGIRNGIDIAKCISLGAKIGGMASPFLKAADRSTETVVETIEEINTEIKVCMFAAGAINLDTLSKLKLISG